MVLYSVFGYDRSIAVFRFRVILRAVFRFFIDPNDLLDQLGFLKNVQPNSFSKLISAVCSFKIMLRGHICLSLISDFVIYM